MTAFLDRIPVERVRSEVDKVHVGRMFLVLLVGVFWLLGWVAGKASLGVQFAFAAVKVGWVDAREPAGRARGPS